MLFISLILLICQAPHLLITRLKYLQNYPPPGVEFSLYYGHKHLSVIKRTNKVNMAIRTMLCTLLIILTALAVSAAVSENVKVSLLEVGEVWLTATQYLLYGMTNGITTLINEYSIWSYIGIAALSYLVYKVYLLLFAPMNRVRLLHEVGYCDDSYHKQSAKDVCNMVKKQRRVGDCPPCYPNGWFAVVESHDLNVGAVKNVSCLGLNLAVFRGEDGRAHVVDAYCPHLGAHLAVGGTVVGDCIQCPFHGWEFNGDTGKCTRIPATTKIPDVARVKAYNTLELNGYVHIWHHAEDIEPTWTPPELEEITNRTWKCRGRTEHYINVHIEEVPENGSDLAHLPRIHSPSLVAGVDLRYCYSKIWNFAQHKWTAYWEQEPDPNLHIGTLTLKHSLCLFGIKLSILDMNVAARQIGPGLAHMTFNSIFGRGAFVHSLTPVEPLVQKVIDQVWCEWYIPPIIPKILLFGEATMIERDMMIWNNKQYLGRPVFANSREDTLIQKHRRWYSQFYSENSPTIQSLAKNKATLDW